MDDLDNLLEGELASINEMFHQFEIKDKKTEERIKTEQEELAKLQSKKVSDTSNPPCKVSLAFSHDT